MVPYLQKYQPEFEKIISFYTSELAGIRTGRATPALVENIRVNAYESKMPLMQLASISSPEPRLLLIQPWDKGILKNIEKAILETSLGLVPVIDGGIIRIFLPQLTEEKRKELIKLAGQKAEQARIGLRGVRDRIKEEILKQEKEKTINEDEKFQFLKELDEAVAEYNKRIKEITEKKEEEILII